MLLHELLGKRIKGDVGIEIECEGKNLPDEIARDSGWSVVADGSLRGGFEYIFRGAKHIKDVPKLLDVLNEKFKQEKSVLDFSFRTSVHVHVNCLDLNFVQVLNCIYAYALFEPALIHFSGEGRKANRFCLGIPDAEGLMDILHNLFQLEIRGDDFPPFYQMYKEDHVRYAAVNIGSLAKHGTIEIRSMRGTNDKAVLVPWANILVSIRDWAIKFNSPSDIYKYARAAGILKAFKEVAKDDFHNFYYPGMEEEMEMSMSLTIDLPHAQDFRKKEHVENPWANRGPQREDIPGMPAIVFLNEALEDLFVDGEEEDEIDEAEPIGDRHGREDDE